MVEKLDCWEYGERGEELKVPHHASAAAARDGNLPQIMAACLYSQHSLNKRITATAQAQRLNTKNLTGGIRNKKGYWIKLGYSIPLINNLEIKFFKNKGLEKRIGVINFINRIV